MKMVSLKLREDVFQEVEKVTHTIHMPRNAYINQALVFYNTLNRRQLLKHQLRAESKAVQADSLRILEEFERLEDSLPA